VSKKITDKAGNPKKSTIHPTGFDLPTDVVEKIFWDHFLPEWRSQQCLPNDFRQDICLLARMSYPRYCMLSERKDVILTRPFSHSKDGVHGNWSSSEGSPRSLFAGNVDPPASEGWGRQSALRRHGFHFEANWSSRDPEEAYGEEHGNVFQKIIDQTNWNKVEILNHIRSIECPVLMIESSYTDPDRGNYGESYDSPDSMEVRELTEEDVRKRGIGSYEETRGMDQIILDETLNQIIRNNLEIEGGGYSDSDGPGTANGIIWHPGLNCPGKVTFATR